MATPIPTNHARFTVEEILRATSGTLVGPQITGEVSGVVTDSRLVTAGCVFVALHGERHDAHRFLPEVAHAGARLAIVRRGASLPQFFSAIEVDDTQRALGELARLHRQRWGRRVVAITGSAGKTTTKELTAAALNGIGLRVHKTSGNLNNAIGVPMTLFQLGAEHDVAVIEVGTNARGEIAWLAGITCPDIAVVTEVAAAHTEGLGNVEDVAVEKTDLLRAVPSHGVAIWNADNAHLVAAVGEPAALGPRTLTFGTQDAVDVRLSEHHATAGLRERCTFDVRDPKTRCEVSLRLLGAGAALDTAAALAVVIALQPDAQLSRAADAMALLVPTAGRMYPMLGNDQVLYLDDSYNANPISTERSLRAAQALAAARNGRLIAVLGDMKELGDESVPQHRRIGRLAVELEVAAFIGCGAEMATACDAAMGEAARHRLPHTTRVMHVIDPLGAVPIVRAQIEANDVVLIKGSRSMQMERVLRELAPQAGAA